MNSLNSLEQWSSTNPPQFIYKVLSTRDWNEAKKTGIFKGSDVDIRDGYIHFSTNLQLAETLRLYFRNQPHQILLQIPYSKLPSNRSVFDSILMLLDQKVLWEPARRGLFPHLYDHLKVDVVSQEWNLEVDSEGYQILPDNIC